MTLNDVLEMADAYHNLGWAVIDQLNAVANDASEESIEAQNPNALRIARDEFLSVVKRIAADYDDAELLQDVREMENAIAPVIEAEK